MAIMTDPDLLVDGTEIVVNNTSKLVQLVQTGNLTSEGVTIKCVYSKLKELWKSDTTYIKYPFPMGPITDEQFEMVNGWDWTDDTTRYLLRTGGWALKDSGGVSQEEWAGIITLGTIQSTHQAYFRQAAAGSAINFQLTGPVNQAVKVYGDATHGNFDYRSYLKIYCRVYQYSYAFSQLSDIGVTSLSYQAYRFPLANASDVKVTVTDANIIGNAPYFGTATQTGTAGATTINDPTFTEVGKFVAGDVGKFICIDTGANAGFYEIITFTDADNVECARNFLETSSTITYSVNPVGMKVQWYATPQSRTIGATAYDFTIIIDGNSGTAEQIYMFTQYQLRQNNDIDAGAGTKTGVIIDAILRFVGDTLYTLDVAGDGCFIDNYLSADVNRLVFTDDTAMERTFPYIATLNVNFGGNLTNDSAAQYWVYFTDTPSADYGDASAVLVNTANVSTSTYRARASNVATITTALVHNLLVGDGVVVATVGGTGYNGTQIVVSVPDTTHFTYANAGTDEAEIADTAGVVTQNMSGKVNGETTRAHSFDYENNVQGGRTADTNAPVTAVAIGLSTSQFVKATATIFESSANSASLVSPLERNYANPA